MSLYLGINYHFKLNDLHGEIMCSATKKHEQHEIIFVEKHVQGAL